MNKLLKLTFLFLSLTLIQCSSDDSADMADLRVDGAEFKLEQGLIARTPGSVQFSLIEKNSDGDGRIISIFAMHESGQLSGTYELRSNLIAPGVANIAIFDAQLNQIAGGSTNQPTGTLTIIHNGGRNYKLVFNDVVLDPATANETSVSGSCVKTFIDGVIFD